MWPTCSRVLVQKIKSLLQGDEYYMSTTSEPCEYGWRLENNKYQIEWLGGQTCSSEMDILDIDEEEFDKLSTNLLYNN